MDTPSPELKILVADDSPIYRKLVEQALSQEHYTVLFAKNGRQAMDLFAEHQPGVVITDWTMPDISGIELCQRIRRESLSSTPMSSCLPATPTKKKSSRAWPREPMTTSPSPSIPANCKPA